MNPEVGVIMLTRRSGARKPASERLIIDSLPRGPLANHLLKAKNVG